MELFQTIVVGPLEVMDWKSVVTSVVTKFCAVKLTALCKVPLNWPASGIFC